MPAGKRRLPYRLRFITELLAWAVGGHDMTKVESSRRKRNVAGPESMRPASPSLLYSYVRLQCIRELDYKRDRYVGVAAMTRGVMVITDFWTIST